MIQPNVQEVADAIGIYPQTLRVRLQNNVYNWGKAFKNRGSNQYSYTFHPEEFRKAYGEAIYRRVFQITEADLLSTEK